MNPERRQLETVTASEIASWVYCPESFRLSALGHQSANRAVLDAGTAHHADLAVAETRAGGSIALGRILIVLAVLALAALWIFSR